MGYDSHIARREDNAYFEHSSTHALVSGFVVGRFFWGWRGMVAVRWTLTGFGLLLLGYFGSKVVLELILQRG